MPSILKHFMNPKAEEYVLPEALELEDFEPDPIPAALSDDEVEAGEEPAPPHPKNPVDYATLQAEMILADAHREADEIRQKALEDAQEEIEARGKDGYTDGYRTGLSEGASRAAVEAQAELEKQAAQLQQQVQQFLESATLAREEMLDATAAEMRDLALAVAEKVVRVSLKSSSEIIMRMILSATETLKRKEWVRIYIASCDSRGMAQAPPTLTSALAAVSDHVKIVPMADDESGTCLVEMPDGIIDASAATQLANIRDQLADLPLQRP